MFWGLQVDPELRYSQQVRDPFRLTKATLDADSACDIKSSVVQVVLEHGDVQYVIATLKHGEIYESILDLRFSEGEDVCFFLRGAGTVYLVGHSIEESADHETAGLDRAEVAESSGKISVLEKHAFGRKHKGLEISEVSDDAEVVRMNGGKPVQKKIGIPLEPPQKKTISALINKSVTVSESEDDGDNDDFDEDLEEDDFDEDVEDEFSEDLDSCDEEVSEADSDVPASVRKLGQKRSSAPVAEPLSAKKPKRHTLPNGIVTPKSHSLSGGDGNKPKESTSKKFKLQTPQFTPTASKSLGSADQSGKQSKTPSGSGEGLHATREAGVTPLSGGSVAPPSKDKERKDAASSAKSSPSSVSNTVPARNEDVKELKVTDVRHGSGLVAKRGKIVHVYYTGRLLSGEKFDECISGKPMSFKLGAGKVILGWDQGLEGMRVGGKRRLLIPSKLAYGKRAVGPIPSNSALCFEVELKAVN